MGRCVQLPCVWCLLSKVKVLRFNYQKMFAVGSVPREARQGRGCGALCAAGQGDAPALGAQRARAHPGMSLPRGSELQGFQLSLGPRVHSCSVTPSAPLWSLWHPCGGLVQEAGPAGDSLSFSFRKNFPPEKVFPRTMSPRHLTTGRGVGHGGAVRVLHP